MGKIDSWAITWYASTFLSDMLSLYPNPSLVKNIGQDNSGTHSGPTKIWGDTVSNDPVLMNKIQLEESDEARREFEKFFRTLRSPRMLYNRGVNKFLRMIRNR